MKIKKLKDKLNKKSWYLMNSDILGEPIYIIRNKEISPPNKNIITYTIKEVKMLLGVSKEYMRGVHLIKKELGARIIKFSNLKGE